MDEKTIARFWRKVDKRTPSECWPWLGGRPKDNRPGKSHGLFSWFLGLPGRRNRTVCAHRFAFAAANGVDIDSLNQLVLHRCDNPICCNPDHLFAGTHQDNVDDMFAKGRGRKAFGSAHGLAILNEDQVREIRAKFKNGTRAAVIAAAYGIRLCSVYDITSGRSWRHVE